MMDPSLVQTTAASPTPIALLAIDVPKILKLARGTGVRGGMKYYAKLFLHHGHVPVGLACLFFQAFANKIVPENGLFWLEGYLWRLYHFNDAANVGPSVLAIRDGVHWDPAPTPREEYNMKRTLGEDARSWTLAEFSEMLMKDAVKNTPWANCTLDHAEIAKTIPLVAYENIMSIGEGCPLSIAKYLGTPKLGSLLLPVRLAHDIEAYVSDKYIVPADVKPTNTQFTLWLAKRPDGREHRSVYEYLYSKLLSASSNDASNGLLRMSSTTLVATFEDLTPKKTVTIAPRLFSELQPDLDTLRSNMLKMETTRKRNLSVMLNSS